MAETSALTLGVKDVKQLLAMSGITYSDKETEQFVENIPQKYFDRFCGKIDDLIVDLHNKYFVEEE